MSMSPLAVFLLSQGLTQREIEVSELVALGLRSEDIGQRLFIAEKSVKFHLTNIYRKLGFKRRSQLILHCAPHIRPNGGNP